MVVLGGYYFVRPELTFPLTVYVHGQKGPSDIVLRNSGRVVIKLGPEMRSESIGENGQAYFPAIAANFRGKEAPIWVESEEFEVANSSTQQKLIGPAIDLTIQRKIRNYQLSGAAFDTAGNPLPSVRVSLPEYKVETQTDNNGRFGFQVSDVGQRAVSLIAQKQGYDTIQLSPTLGDPSLKFSMQRSH